MKDTEVELSVTVKIMVVSSVGDFVVDVSILIVEEASVDRAIIEELVVCDVE